MLPTHKCQRQKLKSKIIKKYVTTQTMQADIKTLRWEMDQSGEIQERSGNP